MRNLFFLLLFAIQFNSCSSQPGRQASMYRFGATHEGYIADNYDPVYDTRAWQFDAGSAVRSTPLVNKGTVYFGNASGDFFALDKKTGQVKWQYHTGKAIHSSAACSKGLIYFSDNGQMLYAIKESNGQLAWSIKLGNKLGYPWRFDYYYSSPVLQNNILYTGSDDGNLYAVNASNGRLIWKFHSTGLVRSTPAIYKDQLLFGDTEGMFYCLELDGHVKWTYKIIGQPLILDSIGFDRKAILAAPVVTRDKVIFGARDGYLYCLDVTDGRLSWTMNHHVSWIISTVAVKDTFIVTGTSDAAFVQAISLNTGRQIWKYQATQPIWSSPIITNDKVYEGCFDGQLFCLDLKTGKRISEFSTEGIIFSSPVIDDSLLYIGSDDGHLYALKGHEPIRKTVQEKYVYYDAGKVNVYFHHGAEQKIKDYLVSNGFKLINTDTLLSILSSPSPAGKVIVYATDIFTKVTIEHGQQSLIRQFLDKGGRIVLPGNNSLLYEIDESPGRGIMGLSKHRIDSVLSLDYGPADTRDFGGLFPGFPNDKGKYFDLPAHWVSGFGIDKKNVDVVLGENENGQGSAFIKRYGTAGHFVQLYLDADLPVNLDAIIKLAEWELD